MRQVPCPAGWRVVGSVVLVVLGAVAGCTQHYVVPGGPADFRALGVSPEVVNDLTDASIAQRLQRVPLASFPAAIAMVRVQETGYRSYTARGVGQGRYCVVPIRDVETDAQIERLSGLPMVRGIAPLNRLVLPEGFVDDRELRAGAAAVHADMLLVYTFDTRFEVRDEVPPLGVLTLGLFPDDHARVDSTVSAVLMDTRNAYVYALVEATAHREQTTSGWTRDAVVDQARRDVESEAFDRIVDRLVQAWRGVVDTYGPSG